MTKEHAKKTNAIRELDAAKLPYQARLFEAEGTMTGVEIARLAGVDPDRAFKTLVTQGKSGRHLVFMVPVACELDLKKAADAAGEKAVAMVKSKELLGLTGYIHGGCSPIGMKKQFPTFIDEMAQLYDAICFSGGRIGCQLEMSLADLQRIVPVQTADLVVV